MKINLNIKASLRHPALREALALAGAIPSILGVTKEARYNPHTARKSPYWQNPLIGLVRGNSSAMYDVTVASKRINVAIEETPKGNLMFHIRFVTSHDTPDSFTFVVQTWDKKGKFLLQTTGGCLSPDLSEKQGP